MVRAKKAAQSELTDTSEENGTPHDEPSAIEEGKTLDYITDRPVADNDKERVRQRIARALFHEYGIAVARLHGGRRRRRHGARLQG